MSNSSATRAPLTSCLTHLSLAEKEQERLSESVSFSELHAHLAEAEDTTAGTGGDLALTSARARLQLNIPELGDTGISGVDIQDRTFLKISPPTRRAKAIPEPWRINILVRDQRRLTGRSNPPKPKHTLPRTH